MKKKLLFFTLLLAVGFNANASSRWSVDVKDDLFSETGERAVLTSSGQREFLLFECESNQLEMAFLARSRQTYNDSWRGGSMPIRLIIKVDEHPPLNFDAGFNRRNEYYMHAVVRVSYSESEELLPVLEQIEGAQSKILVGLDGGEDFRQSATFGVSGSTAATARFIKACGLN